MLGIGAGGLSECLQPSWKRQQSCYSHQESPSVRTTIQCTSFLIGCGYFSLCNFFQESLDVKIQTHKCAKIIQLFDPSEWAEAGTVQYKTNHEAAECHTCWFVSFNYQQHLDHQRFLMPRWFYDQMFCNTEDVSLEGYKRKLWIRLTLSRWSDDVRGLAGLDSHQLNRSEPNCVSVNTYWVIYYPLIQLDPKTRNETSPVGVLRPTTC